MSLSYVNFLDEWGTEIKKEEIEKKTGNSERKWLNQLPQLDAIKISVFYNLAKQRWSFQRIGPGSDNYGATVCGSA